MRTILLPPLEDWQKDVFKDLSEANKSGKIFVVKAKRQVGKSVLADLALIKYSLEHNFSTSIIVEPSLAQCRRRFKAICKMMKGSHTISSQNSTLLLIEFINGSEILFKSAEQDENLRGMTVNNGILVIDEAAYIGDSIINTLYPCVDANRAPILFISTPLFKSGEFYNMYHEGLKDNPIVKSYDWTKYDTSKFLSAEKLEFYRQKVAPLKFRTDYLGEFIEEDSFVFGNILKNIYKEYDTTSPIEHVGIDWGAGGGGDNDYTVLTLMNGKGQVQKFIAFNDKDPVAQIEFIAQILQKLKPTLKSVLVEQNSIGEIYYSMLIKKTQGINIIQFETTNWNKRRIIEQLIQGFELNKLQIPNDSELIKQMQHYVMQKIKTGYTYNGESGYHDDYIMSLAFCYEAYLKHSNKSGVRWA